jgi:HD-GYP domain-containing protein (c-di-GMP phosphodiesterase class II)
MIRRPLILILSILAAQIACLVAGVLWYATWQDAALRHIALAEVRAENARIVDQTAAHLDDLLARIPADATSTRERRMQSAIELVPLPRHTRLCVMDGTGTLVADPRLRQEPALRQTHPGLWLLQTAAQVAPVAEQLAAAGATRVSGQAETADGVEVLAARRIGESDYAVIAHRVVSDTEPVLLVQSAVFRNVGLALVIALVLITGAVTVRIVTRYESRLSLLNRELEAKVFRRTSALVQTRDAVIFGLSRLADSRDRETGAHIARLQRLVVLLARHLRPHHPEIDEAWIERLRLATGLHDIGKVGIPDAILLKPGRLTPDERRIMQNHAEIGAQCLAAIGERLGENDFLAMARDIAWCHHEWWNGAGYPRGLRGTAIPLAARIVAVADVYDAASSARVYKSAMSPDAVLALIISHRGVQFDPSVVDAFLAVESEFRTICTASAGEPGAPRRRRACVAAEI